MILWGWLILVNAGCYLVDKYHIMCIASSSKLKLSGAFLLGRGTHDMTVPAGRYGESEGNNLH